MIGKKIRNLLVDSEKTLVKPAEEVAVVGLKNRLNHAYIHEKLMRIYQSVILKVSESSSTGL